MAGGDTGRNVGAFWEKESKNGDTYLSGVIDLPDGAKMNVVVFKNTHKQPGENTPDWRVFPQRPREEDIVFDKPAF